MASPAEGLLPGQGLLRLIGTAKLQDRAERRRAAAAADRIIELSGDRQRAAADVTAALLERHEQARRANGGVCRLGGFHQLLAVAALVAFRWRLDDTPLVCRLLTAVAGCESTLERLLAGAIFGPCVTYLVSGSKADLSDRAECLRFAEYLLSHAAAADLRITVNTLPCGRRGWDRSYRAVDLPLLSYESLPPLHAAVAQCRTDAVLALLRLGARLSFLPLGAPLWSDSRHSPMEHLCHRLNSEVESHVLTGRPYSSERCAVSAPPAARRAAHRAPADQRARRGGHRSGAVLRCTTQSWRRSADWRSTLAFRRCVT
ncbi:hypothetical protein FJT64_001939 [Amphibalanus amphitrite]|uniref:Uncharacterized protein n=1 Tax=Amphibalanus amphitrite TaxID=1232801 RepID=A0A6A4X8T7_AMPAM|nr:hypothetical protein FJT64_001939 [Amphibalanus amphitrite]